MANKRKHHLLFYALLACFGLQAQADANRFYDYMDVYNKATSLKSHFKVKAYDHAGGIIYSMSGKLWKHGDAFFQDIGVYQFLVTKDMQLMKINKERTMVLKARNHETEAIMHSDDQLNYLKKLQDSLTTFRDSIQYRGLVSGQHHFTIYSANQMIAQTDIYFDQSSKLLAMISYSYNDQFDQSAAKLVIEYVLNDSQARFNSNDFSLFKYLRQSKGVWEPAPDYADFTFIDETKS